MVISSKHAADSHTQLILSRYADRENIRVGQMDPDVLVARYLSKIMVPGELSGKTILEIGAGCSQYAPIFMKYNCKRYYANDIIPERLKVIRVNDPRYVEIPGDFRVITLPEPVDIIFANLTMMFVIPMLEDFVQKIVQLLKSGGTFISMDPNYLCPVSVFRRLSDRKNNPARLFNPFGYAKTFRKYGFGVEAMVPFTAPWPSVTGNWLFGTNFWLRARKK